MSLLSRNVGLASIVRPTAARNYPPENKEAAGYSGGLANPVLMTVYKDSRTSSAILLISSSSALSIETTLSWKLAMQ